MGNKKQELNLHTKRYIQAVFEMRLREEGFVCPNDKLLCWYRVKNDEIVNSIIFFSPWANMPVMLWTGYGIHPLFQMPAYTNSVSFPQRPFEWEYFLQQSIVENYPINAMRYTMFSPDIWVYAPGHDGKGIYTFDGIILPQMASANTIEACYQRHKENRLSRAAETPFVQFAGISDVFVDGAIYLGDVEVYPYCEKSIEKHLALYQKFCEEKPDKKEYQTELQNWEMRRIALLDGARDEYLKQLKNRAAQNLVKMKKKHMID